MILNGHGYRRSKIRLSNVLVGKLSKEVDPTHILKTVKEFQNLWQKNRGKFNKARPKFHTRKINPFSKTGRKLLLNHLSDNANYIKGLFGFKKDWRRGNSSLLWHWRNHIVHYDYRVENGKPVIKKFKKPWPNEPIVNGKLSPACKDALFVKPTKYCKFLGFTDFHVGTQSSKVLPINKYFSEFIKSNPGKYEIHEPRVMVTGSWETNYRNIQEMTTPPKAKLSYMQINNAICRRMNIDLKLPICPNITSDHVLHCPVNPFSYSGLITSRLFGSTREICSKVTSRLSATWFNHIKKEPTPCFEMYCVGAREKAAKVWSEGPSITRLVLMTEDVLNRIAGAFGTEFNKRTRFVRGGSIYIAQSLEKCNYIDFKRTFSNPSRLNISADWKMFDDHCYEQVIVSAMGIFRSCFPRGEAIDNVFLYITSSLVFKYIVLPGGYVYRIDKGLPSGNPLTSVIGTLINWILWSYIVCRMCNNDQKLINNSRLVLMGDDGNISYDNRVDDSNIFEIIAETGFVSDIIEGETGNLFSAKDETGIKFLKKRFNYLGQPFWDYKGLFYNLYCPASKVINAKKEYDRTTALLYTAPFEGKSTELLQDYRKFLQTKQAIEGAGIEWISLYNKGRLMSQSVAKSWFNIPHEPRLEGYKGEDDWFWRQKRVFSRRGRDPTIGNSFYIQSDILNNDVKIEFIQSLLLQAKDQVDILHMCKFMGVQRHDIARAWHMLITEGS